MGRSLNRLDILSLQYYCYPDEIGGAWKYTHEVNRRLVERGHRVFLITCKTMDDLPDYEVIDGVSWYRIDVKASKNVYSLARQMRRQLKTILHENAIDLVHVHNPLIEIAGFSYLPFWRLPKVYHFHSLWCDEERINRIAAQGKNNPLSFQWQLEAVCAMIRGMEWFCFKTAKQILFLSQYSKERFEEFYPFHHAMLNIIPGGVDIENYRPGVTGLNQKECRERLGLPSDAPILLTVRRLAARMGLENLITACGLIRDRAPDLNFYLTIVGKGDLFDKLSSQIRESGLEDCIRLAGKITGEEIHTYYEAADLFVLPTLSIEGFGLATVEALSSGLPVLGTPVGGTVEILESIDSKLLFDGTTPQALADRIESFLQNPKPYFALKEVCRRKAVEKYDWNRVVDRLEEAFYDKVTESPNG